MRTCCCRCRRYRRRLLLHVLCAMKPSFQMLQRKAAEGRSTSSRGSSCRCPSNVTSLLCRLARHATPRHTTCSLPAGKLDSAIILDYGVVDITSPQVTIAGEVAAGLQGCATTCILLC